MTWAARALTENTVLLRLNGFSGVVTVEPPPEMRIWSCKHSQIWPKSAEVSFSGRLMASRCCAAWQKPPPIQVEFSVTTVFCVRIVHPLDAATAEKWQGRPHLAKAKGVGRVRLHWNLPKASLRAMLTQRSVMTGSIFEPSRCRFVRVPLLQISPAYSGDLFHNRCWYPGIVVRAVRQSLQPRKHTGGQCVLLFLKRR